MQTETKLADMTHDEAIAALCGCAATVTVLSYQEAIEGYFKLRGMDWNQRTAKTYADGLEDAAKVAVDKLKWLGDNTQADIVFDAIRALAKGDV